MANVVSDEILKLKIVINGDEAQKRILNLELANKKLSTSIDEQRDKLRKLSYNRSKNKEEIQKTRAVIAKLTAEYNDNLRKIDAEIKSMDKMSLTTQQLKRRMNELAFTMHHMNPNDPNYKLAQAELEKLDSRYRQLRSGMNATAFSLKELSNKINKYSAFITTAVVAITSMVVIIRKAIDVNNKLADAQSSVAKTTGLSIEKVKELTEAFKEFDTRTSQLDLLKIAEIGGRLGVAKEEIKDFTREVDKVYVALGDGFSGGVEQVAESLGKLKGLYKETRDLPIAEAMNKIGSSINELGAAGAASEDNITEFALRIGSLPDSMRPAISEALALGAAFEESGVDAERSGTAYSNFIRIAAKNTEKFAKVMRKSNEEVKNLINSNPMEFFLQFAEGTKGLEATDLSKILDGLKLNNQYVASIVTAASDNMDRFRKSIALANQEYEKGTSLAIEFQKMNENLAATSAKIKKAFTNLFTDSKIVDILTYMVEKFGQLIGAVKDTDGTMTRLRETIIFLTKIVFIGVVAVASYNTAVLLTSKVFTEATGRLIGYTVAQKLYNVYTTTSTFLMNLWTATTARAQLAIGVLTKNTAMQTVAQAKLNAVTAANPWAAVIAVVLALAAAVYLFSKNTDEATQKQKLLNDVRTKAANAVVAEKTQLENLLSVAKNENIAKEERLKAIKRLNAISPEYLGNLTLENLKTAEGTKLINSYIKALDRKAYAEALSAKRTELWQNQFNIQNEEIKPFGGDVATWMEQKLNRGNLKRTMSLSEAKELDFLTNVAEIEKKLSEYVPSVVSAYRERRKELKENFKQIQILNTEQKKYIETNPGVFIDSNSSSYQPLSESGGTKKNGKINSEKKAEQAQKKYEQERQKILETSENFNQKMIELEAERQKAMAELQENGYEKERAILLADQKKTFADLEKQKISNKEFAKLRSMIDKEKGQMKIRLQEIEYQWRVKNTRISDLQELEQQKNHLKLLALQEKYIKESYKKEEDALEKRLKLIEREKNEKLAFETLDQQKQFLRSQGYTEENLKKIKTWEIGRKVIEKEYQKKRLEEQLDFLKKKVAEFNIMAQINPISLSPKQLEIIEEYKNKIADLVAEITNLKNGGREDSGNGRKNNSESDLLSRSNTDILGLTPEQWDTMFTNTKVLEENMKKVAAAIMVAKEAFSVYSDFVTANEERMLKAAENAYHRKQDRLEKQLAAGMITQEEYKKQTIQNEKKLDKLKAEIEYKQAKRQRAIQIAETISNTAMAIMSIWAQVPKFDFGVTASILTGIVSALGALKVATILSQPLPEVTGAEEGLYPIIREQDGKVFSARKKRSRSGVYNEPTLLVGEGGSSMPELVVSGRDLKKLDPELTQMFMREIDRVRGYEKGMYPTSPSPIKPSGNDEIMIKIMAVLQENTAVMKEIKDYGITATIGETAQNGKKIEKMVKEYQTLYNRNKKG